MTKTTLTNIQRRDICLKKAGYTKRILLNAVTVVKSENWSSNDISIAKAIKWVDELHYPSNMSEL